jgi:hypothetical protein
MLDLYTRALNENGVVFPNHRRMTNNTVYTGQALSQGFGFPYPRQGSFLRKVKTWPQRRRKCTRRSKQWLLGKTTKTT